MYSPQQVKEKVMLSTKDFTIFLRDFIKEHSPKSDGQVDLDLKDAITIFVVCEEVILDANMSNGNKYNAIRWLKKTLSNKHIFLAYHENILSLIKHCLLHKSGNTLTELGNLMDEFMFMFRFVTNWNRRKKKTEKKIYHDIFPKIADFYIKLQKYEYHYQVQNEDELDREDLSLTGRYVYSGDTKDKFLKHIRKISERINNGDDFIEQMRDSGYLSKLMDKYGNEPEKERIKNMVPLTQTQKDKLRGETGPYSEVKVIKETRILDDSVSRTMVYIECNINPLTFEIIQANQDKIPEAYDIEGFIETADYRGQAHGYVVQLSPTFQYFKQDDVEIMEKVEQYRQQAEDFIILLHKFVMHLLNIKN